MRERERERERENHACSIYKLHSTKQSQTSAAQLCCVRWGRLESPRLHIWLLGDDTPGRRSDPGLGGYHSGGCDCGHSPGASQSLLLVHLNLVLRLHARTHTAGKQDVQKSKVCVSELDVCVCV